ncbi:class I SAM-dependent methyltransferase [Azospirillum griseum]|uniref:Class I SAM-dependent methyltransferase n=1 Tax=Azospirillum griseum TaxID=2496639 RepID=A0A3S0HU38_9PROT|nr:class I SAM-dependent methyltransferase [Azospirillum griseum]RTR15548.1 class I SAM-dependent methyltransferase [Azospirillum griseum]
MAEVNLLNSIPRIARDVGARLIDKEENRRLAMKFGWEYFDGPREQGYGGYRYDGRWVAVAHRIINHFGLKPGDRVLDIGCAKGFLVKDLADALPGLEVWGMDVSSYALENAHPDARTRLLGGSCDRLPFADGSFTVALAINSIHNLDRDGCLMALREMQRVAPRGGFVQVDAYRSETERLLLEDWMLTARTYLDPEGWKAMLSEAGYFGDWYWTILEADPAFIRR